MCSPRVGAGRSRVVGVLSKRAAARAWRIRPATGWSVSMTTPVASICGCSRIFERGRIGAQGTCSASSRSSHSSVVRVGEDVGGLIEPLLRVGDAAAGRLEAVVVEPLGTTEGAEQPLPLRVRDRPGGHEPVLRLEDEVLGEGVGARLPRCRRRCVPRSPRARRGRPSRRASRASRAVLRPSAPSRGAPP